MAQVSPFWLKKIHSVSRLAEQGVRFWRELLCFKTVGLANVLDIVHCLKCLYTSALQILNLFR